jgi:hypothetical protein
MIEVEPDAEAWIAANAPHFRPRPSARTKLRLWPGLGPQVEVVGERRAQVEGLVQQLRETLQPGVPRLHWLDPTALGPVVSAPILLGGVLLGDRIPQWWGVSKSDSHIDRWEGLGAVLGLGVATAAVVGLYFLFPRIEVLADGEVPRLRRLRRLVFGASWAVGLTFLGVILDRVL